MSKAEYFKAERLKLEAQGLSQVDVWERLESVILSDSKLFQRWTDSKIRQDAEAHKPYRLKTRVQRPDQSIDEATAHEWEVQRQASLPFVVEPLAVESTAPLSKFIGPSRRPAMLGTAKVVKTATINKGKGPEDKTTWQPKQGIPVLSR